MSFSKTHKKKPVINDKYPSCDIVEVRALSYQQARPKINLVLEDPDDHDLIEEYHSEDFLSSGQENGKADKNGAKDDGDVDGRDDSDEEDEADPDAKEDSEDELENGGISKLSLPLIFPNRCMLWIYIFTSPNKIFAKCIVAVTPACMSNKFW